MPTCARSWSVRRPPSRPTSSVSREIVGSLRQFLAQEEEMRRIMAQASFEIEEKTADPIKIAGIRTKGRYADCGAIFARIGKRFGRHIRGKPMLLHYDTEYREDDADYEVCMPVRAGKPVDEISVRELPGGRCVSLLHQGPYDQLGRSYAKILDYIRGKGLEIRRSHSRDLPQRARDDLPREPEELPDRDSDADQGRRTRLSAGGSSQARVSLRNICIQENSGLAV